MLFENNGINCPLNPEVIGLSAQSFYECHRKGWAKD